jgi:hypothetical protein
MCYFPDKLKYLKGPRTVYKVALLDKKTGEISSISTNLVYKPGPVPERPSGYSRVKRLFNFTDFLTLTLSLKKLRVIKRNGIGFNSTMIGRVSGFVDEEGTRSFISGRLRTNKLSNTLSNHNLVIIKLTITKALIEGSYRDFPVIAGREILNVEVIREYKAKKESPYELILV